MNWLDAEIQRKYHEVASLFPLMEGDEFEALKADIAQNGLIEAIWLHPNGSIIDGRNRHRACIELELLPKFRTWNGNGSLVSFVVSMNLHRRHLNESQRDMIAARIANMPQGTRTDLEHSLNLDQVSAKQAATLMNVSRAGVFQAKKVIEQGTQGLQDAVDSGRVAVSLAASVASWDDEDQEEFIAAVEDGRKPTSAAHSIRKKKATIEAQNAPAGVFNVILADPPWEYANTIAKWGPAQMHYSTMSIDEICELPSKISLRIDNNAVLFLWTTNAMLEDAFQVIKAWGFQYKTNMVWVKENLGRPGAGWYVRGRHELLLICTKGAFTPLNENISPPIGSVITAQPGEHSKKPEEIYGIIESLYPECHYIELFARAHWEGWSVYGNETER